MKIKKVLMLMVALLLMFTTVLTACSNSSNNSENTSSTPSNNESTTSPGQPRKGGTLIVAANAEVMGLDLHTSTVLADRIPLLNVQEMLVTIDDNMKVVPMLAESWETSEDGLVYTFHLRKGVKFHNGKEMKAEDVKYSIERFMNVSARANEFNMVNDIEIVDDYTVNFRLKEPSGVLLASLTNPYNPAVIMPAGIAEEQGGKVTNPIGTGPFKFESWTQGKELVLTRFDEYSSLEGEPSGFGGGKTPYLDKVVFRFITDPTVRKAALETGEVDLALEILPKDIGQLKNKAGIVAESVSSMNWGYLSLGFKKPPFDNPLMRQAVAYAINKDEITEVATDGTGIVAASPISPDMDWYTEAHANDIQQDVERAKQLLAEAGYNGEKIVISTSKAYDSIYKAALVLQQQLADIGMNVEVETLEWASFVSTRTNTGDYHMVSSLITARPDPNQVFYSYLHSSSNFNGYKSEKMDSLLDQAAAETDQEKRKALYDEVIKLLREEVPFLALYHPSVNVAWREKVKGFKVWGAGYPRLWNVWLEE